jgi:two-component system sensor histidine kinase GlrK
MRLGLRQKLFGGYLVLLLMLVVIAGLGAFTLHRLMDDYQRLVETAIPTQRALVGLEEVFRLQTANEQKYYVVGSPAIAELFASQNAEWNTHIDDLAARIDLPDVRKHLASLAQAHGAYTDQVAANMATLGGGPTPALAAPDPKASEAPAAPDAPPPPPEARPEPPPEPSASLGAATRPLIAAVFVELKDLATLVRAKQERALGKTQERAGHVVGITLMLGLITVVFGLAAAWGLSTVFTRPVRRLRAATEEIALGIFDRKVPVASKDEIGDLAAAFNRMAEKLATLDQVRDEFVTYISHELRTPLTSLKEANSLLLDGVAGDLTARQEQLLAIVQEDCLKIERLINELLDLSKMEAGMMHLHREPTGFAPIVAAAVEEMTPVAEKRDIALQMPGGPATEVEADAGRIRQVVTNLISNAIKFSPEGSRVRVSWEVHRDRLICAVADEGPGIPESARDAIFEKFHQLSPAALPAMRGTGLGLPIARRIVEAHGGAVWVECPPQGGSVFRFALPTARVPPRRARPAAPAAEVTA